MKKWIFSIGFILAFSMVHAQEFPEAMAYQAQVSNSSGTLLSEVEVGVQFNIRKNTINGPISWQENHQVTTNLYGHISLVVGAGTSTGVGTASLFSDINWQDGPYFLEMLIDETNSGDFVSSYTQQLMSVPFAYHSKTSSQTYALSNLTDVDTTGIEVGDVLKWDGSAWIPSEDEIINPTDSVSYSYFSNTSNYSDTAGYAVNCISLTLMDSSLYAINSDTANYSLSSYQSDFSNTATYADTALFANYSVGNWGLQGNSINGAPDNFIGTLDSTDLVFKTDSEERMRIKANGDVGIGTSAPLSSFHVNNTSGVLYTGEFGEGVIPVEGAGTRMMWYPGKSAFRVGYVSGNSWDNNSIGDYSFATGFNTRASGMYSVVFGFNSYATSEGAFAVGNNAASTGLYSFAAGHDPFAAGDYSIALGRVAHASGFSSVAIGYHPTASGNYAMGLGNYVFARGDHSFAFGYHARTMEDHDGSFVYADYSTETPLETTAANQFMVRAAGGSVFYTSSDLSTGVTLAPGAGAWSTLSDKNLKENVEEISALQFLRKIDDIDVFSWNYKAQDDEIRHIGPMAQDFYSTFSLGVDPTRINSGDFDGVNLLLLKGLNEKLDLLVLQKEKIEALEQEIKIMREKRKELEKMLRKIEKKQSASSL